MHNKCPVRLMLFDDSIYLFHNYIITVRFYCKSYQNASNKYLSSVTQACIYGLIFPSKEDALLPSKIMPAEYENIHEDDLPESKQVGGNR